MDCIFSAVEENLGLPLERDGAIWTFAHSNLRLNFHHHRELELNLVTQGQAVYLLDDRRYSLRSSSLVWLFPAQNHILLDASPDFKMWILVLRPALVERLCAGAASVLREDNPADAFCRVPLRENYLRLCALFEEVAELKEAAHFNAGLGYALLSAWAAHESALSEEKARRVHPAVEATARLLREEAEPTSLKRLSAQYGLSASRLSTLFKEQTGVPLARYRNQQRLERFLRLRSADANQTKSLLEIALEAGFGSYAQFYRFFKEAAGASPADYFQNLS